MRSILIVFMGGALGAIIRKLFMANTPSFWDGFPLDIFIANILAALLLGVVAALHARKKLGHGATLFIGTGLMGSLSTFSNFVYAAVVLMAASTQGIFVAVVYLVLSMLIGYAAVSIGYKFGSPRKL